MGQIDSAFASRILMALKYELLPDEHRRQLWKNFFEMYQSNDYNIRFDVEAKKYVQSEEVTKMRLNGREIRNGSKKYSSWHNC